MHASVDRRPSRHDGDYRSAAMVSRAAIVSFRLGLTDGVSVVAEGWRRTLLDVGFDVVTVAGAGPVDRLLPGLAMAAPPPPTEAEIEAALADADLTVVENLCTIPLNLPAARRVGTALAGRPAVLHHHDPAWQRPHLAACRELPPQDPAWRHVAINALTRRQLAERGIDAVTIYNGFDHRPPTRGREATRRALGVAHEARLLLHPVRAIPRKDVAAAVDLAVALEATYWLAGPAEDGYGAELGRLLRAARCPVLHRAPPTGMPDAYAACDAVAFPSIWEGFGNPPVEAALHRRPAAVGSYPVAQELRGFGFRWFDPGRAVDLAAFLADPDEDLLDQNEAIARSAFSHARMAGDIVRLLGEAGWLP